MLSSPVSRVLFTLAPFLLLTTPLLGQDWTDRVDPWVLDTTLAGAETEFLVVLDQQADLSGARALRSKAEKGRYVVERLRAVAEETQGPVITQLTQLGVEHRAYWIGNMIWARGDRATVARLASRSDVARISANPSVRLEEPEVDFVAGLAPPIDAVEASITHVGAPDFWNAGFTGQGVVVAGHDTGYDWDHPALIDRYRGWDGATATHDYNWHDAIHSGGGSCGANSPEPCDDNNHGTHTMGTMIGDDGAGNQIGMAPGARWIGCRNMDQGNGTPTTYAECFQFFLAPTDLAGKNPRPDLAPDVINNSWGCPAAEGCTDPNVLRSVVEAARAAGIVVVVSAGNSGSGCSSIDTPAAIYEASFVVGAATISDSIAGFSSRGPVTIDGSNRLKPDVVAPGVSIRSSVRGGGYQGGWQGTSMAGPHVAGQVALLISAAECLRGDVDAIENQILATTVARTSTQQCGAFAGSSVPNPIYGMGAVRVVMPTTEACNDLFTDGFESGNTTSWSVTVD